MKKKVLTLALAGVLLMTSLTGCGSLKEDDVVATVGDQEITAGVANFYARYTQAMYETYYAAYMGGDDMWTTEAEEGKTYEDSVKDSVLEELETMILLEQHAEEYGVSLSDEEKKVIEDAAKQFDDDNKDADKDKVSGSPETVERVMTLIAMEQKMRTAIEDEADTNVSDEEAAQKSMQYVEFAYTPADGESEMTDDEKEEVKKQAEAFAEGAKAAENFDTYVSEQGLEASTATFDADSTNPTAEVVEAADQMKEGEISDVIETDDGCYVVKLTSLLDREATDLEKESIVNERKSEKYSDTCEQWLEEAEIKVHKNVWKKVDFKKLSVTIKQEETESGE